MYDLVKKQLRLEFLKCEKNIGKLNLKLTKNIKMNIKKI